MNYSDWLNQEKQGSFISYPAFNIPELLVNYNSMDLNPAIRSHHHEVCS